MAFTGARALVCPDADGTRKGLAMTRLTAVVLVLLAALTLAPRTSLNPSGGDIELTGIISRTTVRPGSAVTFVVQAQNVTAAVIEDAVVRIAVSFDGKPDQLNVLASRACTLSAHDKGYTATCSLGTLQPDEQRTMSVTARPLIGGVLVFEAQAGSAFGPIPVERPIEVFVRGRR